MLERLNPGADDRCFSKREDWSPPLKDAPCYVFACFRYWNALGLGSSVTNTSQPRFGRDALRSGHPIGLTRQRPATVSGPRGKYRFRSRHVPQPAEASSALERWLTPMPPSSLAVGM